MTSKSLNMQPGDNTSSPLKDLYQNDAPASYMYPSDLDKNDNPYLVFRRVRYEREKRLDLSTRKLLSSIYMPIPAGLIVRHGINYSNVDLGIIGKAIADKSSIDLDQSVMDRISNTGEFAQEQLLPRAFKNVLQGVGDATGVKIREGAELNLGEALNSHMAILFENVGFRTHEFSYKMIARNRQESANIRNIIQTFKYAMHPALAYEGNVFEYPDEWYIHFRKGYRENLYDFTACVLTGLSVNYNGSNVPSFFENTKAPVDIDISLQFQEVEILTKEKIEKEYTNIGGFGQITDNDPTTSEETRTNPPMGLE